MSQAEIVPGLADVPVAKSAVSLIDGKRARLAYRGISVETLARESSFEETAWLLLKGELPTQRELAELSPRPSSAPARSSFGSRTSSRTSRNRPSDGRLAVLGGAPRHVLPASRRQECGRANWEAALRLIAVMPTLVAAFHDIAMATRRSRPAIRTSTMQPICISCSSPRNPPRPCGKCSMPA